MTGKNVGRMLSITLLVVSLVLAGGAWAAQGTPSQPVADPQQAIEALAEYLGVSPEEIQALYDSGVGLGVIAEAYILSDVLLMTPEEIIEAKTSGEINWGELLQEAGLQPGEIKLRLGEIISGARQGLGAGAGDPAAQGEQYQNQEQTQNQEQAQQQQQTQNQNGDQDGSGGQGDNGNSGGSQGGGGGSGGGQGGNGGSGGSQGGGGGSGGGKGK